MHGRRGVVCQQILNKPRWLFRAPTVRGLLRSVCGCATALAASCRVRKAGVHHPCAVVCCRSKLSMTFSHTQRRSQHQQCRSLKSFSGFTRPCTNGGRTYERVLRYPSGQERRIRYPVADEEDSWPGDPTRSYAACINASAEGWDPDRWDSLDIIQASGQVIRTELGSSARSGSAAPAEVQQQDDKVTMLPSSPAELLRHIQSDGYKQAQADQAQRVRGSFEILEGSPWLQSQPIYVLAVQQPDSEHGLTYTLRVRVSKPEAENELCRVLGKRRADGSPLLSVSELRDGIVTFEDGDDAERYGNLLEADGHMEVLVARADSHELFRAAQGVHSLVILLRSGCHLPLPEQLSAALRSKGSWEDGAEA